ncbi:MAG: 30S ribosomal protein S20 [Kiritimatiellia bacterium]
MPNIKSAMKRMRTSEKARVRNRSVKTRITSARRDVMEAFVATDKEKAVGNFRACCSVLDKAAKQGVVKKNTAIRRKRRAAAKLAALG